MSVCIQIKVGNATTFLRVWDSFVVIRTPALQTRHLRVCVRISKNIALRDVNPYLHKIIILKLLILQALDFLD